MSNPLVGPMLVGAAVGVGLGIMSRQPEPARRVFFSFHYQKDIWRVNQVKKHWITKGGQQAAGYFDGSLSEKAKVEGKAAVKKLIDDGLSGSSALCVLIGSETYKRHWVTYEIFKSIELGKGVFGLRIHSLHDKNQKRSAKGQNVFDYLGYGQNPKGDLLPYSKVSGKWLRYTECKSITASAAEYLKPNSKPVLSELFKVYDWVDDDGYNNFSKWVTSAAKQAGR